MSESAKKYTTYQTMATICVAVFVINMAFCLTCCDKYIYNKIYDGTEIIDAQAEVWHSQLVEDFTAFFKGDYDLSGQELLKENVKCLNRIKWRYRFAVMLVIASVLGLIYSYRELKKRRIFGPFIHGCVLAVVFLLFKIFRFFTAGGGVTAAIRAMVVKQSYEYFYEGDILLKLMPQYYARGLALLYIGWVFVLILAVLLLRRLFIWLGRPHKF